MFKLMTEQHESHTTVLTVFASYQYYDLDFCLFFKVFLILKPVEWIKPVFTSPHTYTLSDQFELGSWNCCFV